MTEHPESVERGGVGRSPDAATLPERSGGSKVRSPRGFLGAIVFLLAVPIAVSTQLLFGSGSGAMIHFALATGSVLVAISVFDFETRRWINWIGCVAMSALAAVFFLQGVTDLTQNDSLSYLAYDVLGNWPERVLPDLFIGWLVAMLLMDSWGKTRILGFVVMAIVLCVEAYNIGLNYLGTSLNVEAPSLKVFYLLPFVWLLLESRKKRSPGGRTIKGS